MRADFIPRICYDLNCGGEAGEVQFVQFNPVNTVQALFGTLCFMPAFQNKIGFQEKGDLLHRPFESNIANIKALNYLTTLRSKILQNT